MEIKSYVNQKENEIRYKLIGSRHSTSYRTIDNLVLKVFLENNYYQDVLRIHNDDFLAYLKLLSKAKNRIFTTPETVYTSGTFVRSYVRKFILGTSLGDLYPKTSIEGLINHIESLYTSLKNNPEISLDGVTAKDMIYTGDDIFLTDFDMCTINDLDNYRKNLKLLDKAIFIGLFKCNPESISELNSQYESLVRRLEDEDYHITDYLKEYCESLEKHNISSKYLRSLEHNLILK